MNKVTGKDVVKDATFWIEGYHVDGRWAEVEIKVLGMYDTSHGIVSVEVLGHPEKEAEKLFLSDRGVEPYAYDKRCTQLFHTKEELLEAKKNWHTGNANDYDQEGRNLYSKHGAL